MPKPKKFWKFTNSGGAPEIVLYGAIAQEESWWGGEVTHTQFSNDLKALGSVDEIVVRINSGGGDVFAANAIYALLKDHPAKVTVKIDGWAASAATTIAMAGDTIEIPSNAIFMVHDPQMNLYGTYSKEDCETQAKAIETVKNSIIECYMVKTGKSREELSEIMANETWYTGQEAVEAGFCDKLTFQNTTNEVLNYAGLTPENHKNFPQKMMSLFVASANKIANEEREEKTQKEEGTIMDLETLKQQYPDLVAQIVASAKKEAVQEERERIQNIEILVINGFEEEAEKAKFETGSTPEAYAMVVQKALKAQGSAYLQNREEDSVASNVNKVTHPASGGAEGNVENEATAAYQKYKQRKGL